MKKHSTSLNLIRGFFVSLFVGVGFFGYTAIYPVAKTYTINIGDGMTVKFQKDELCKNEEIKTLGTEVLHIESKYIWKAGTLIRKEGSIPFCYITKDNTPIKEANEVFVIDSEGGMGTLHLNEIREALKNGKK